MSKGKGVSITHYCKWHKVQWERVLEMEFKGAGLEFRGWGKGGWPGSPGENFHFQILPV